MITNVILLDRDGVINYDSLNYIKSPEEFIFIPKSIDAIVKLTVSGYRIGIATNQSGIGRGYYTSEILAGIHEKMLYHIRRAGGNIEAIEYCPHRPEDGCFCRKPYPGMLYALAKRFGCSLDNVFFIGDKISDLNAAKAAGARPIIIRSTMYNYKELEQHPEIPVFKSLMQSVEYLLKITSNDIKS